MGDSSEAPGPGCHHVQCGGGRLPLWALEGHTPSVGQVIPHSLDGEGHLPAPQEARPGCPPHPGPAILLPFLPTHAPPSHSHVLHARSHDLTRHARLCHAAHALTFHTETHNSHVVSHTPLSLSLTHSQGVSHTPMHLSHTHTRLSHRLSHPQNSPMVTPSHLTHILTAHPQSHTQLLHDIYSWSHTHLTHTPLSDTISRMYAQLAHGHAHFSHIHSHTHSHRPPHPECEGVRSYTLVQAPACLGPFSL